MPILIIYASSSGNSESLAIDIFDLLVNKNIESELKHVSTININDLYFREVIIQISPTYNTGRLHPDYEKFYNEIINSDIKLTNTSFINIGLGDSQNYSKFCGSSEYLDEITIKTFSKFLMDTNKVDGELLFDFSKRKLIATEICEVISNFEFQKQIDTFKIDNFINPKSIAIIGASSNKSKVGNQIIKNLIASKYSGVIYPVNLKEEKIEDINCYKSIEDIKKFIGLCVITIPIKGVYEELVKAINLGIKNFVILTSGFNELQSAEGLALSQKIMWLIRENRLRLLGPNCLGFITPLFNLTFAKGSPQKGNISVISQSGAIISELIDHNFSDGIGFNYLFSIGNKFDIDENQLLEFLIKDESTKIIVIYIESFSNPRKFEKLLKQNQDFTKKPILIINPGKTQNSSKSITSHTGAFVNSYEFSELSSVRYGAVIIDSLQNLNLMLEAISRKIDIKSNEFMVLTNAGGPSIILNDLLSLENFKLIELPKEIAEKIKLATGLESVRNPLDMLGDANELRIEKILDIIKEINVSNLIVLLTSQKSTNFDEIHKKVLAFSQTSSTNIIELFLIDKSRNDFSRSDKVLTIFNDNDVIELLKEFLPNLPLINYLTDSLVNTKNNILEPLSTFKLLEKYNISLPKFQLTTDITQITLNFPFFIKANNTSAHKTESNSVKLISNSDELNNFINKFPDQEYLLQEKVNGDYELFIGIKKDERQNGLSYILTFGFGGIYTNLLKETINIKIPFSQTEFDQNLKRLNFYKIFDGFRGKEPVSELKLYELITKLFDLIEENSWIKSIDINPVIIKRDNIFLPDVKIYKI